jgi:hypothetical protein
MISFITVNYKGDKWIKRLLDSIDATMSHLNYEILVVANSPTKLDYSEWATVRFVDNSKTAVVGSEGHAEGLRKGWENLDNRCDTVIFVDQDSAFVKKDWDKDLLKYLGNPFPIMGGPYEDQAYGKSFIRPHFMILQRGVFNDMILYQKGLEPKIPLGDTGYLLTDHVVRASGVIKVLPNSWNWEKHYPAIYKPGCTVYDMKKEPFVHHVGRGSLKPERFAEWEKFLDER